MHAVARAVAATPAVANCARPRGPSNNRRHRFNRPAGAATPGTTRRSRWNSDAAFDATLRERIVAMAEFAASTSAIGASEGDRVTGSEAGAVNGTERELSYNGASSSAASTDEWIYPDDEDEEEEWDEEPDPHPWAFPVTSAAALAAWSVYVRKKKFADEAKLSKRERAKLQKEREAKAKEAEARKGPVDDRPLKVRYREMRAAQIAAEEAKEQTAAAARAAEVEELRKVADWQRRVDAEQRSERMQEALKREANRRAWIEASRMEELALERQREQRLAEAKRLKDAENSSPKSEKQLRKERAAEEKRVAAEAVSYTHLTLPTNREV